MKTAPKTSSLSDSDALPFLKERAGHTLRWFVPLLLAASPLLQAQMLHSDPSSTSHNLWRPAPHTEVLARMSFSEETTPLVFPKLRIDAPAKGWVPFYPWSPGAGSGERGRAAISLDEAQEIPEPSLGAALFGGLLLLVSFNLLRRRRGLV